MKILEKRKKRENRGDQAHAHPSNQLLCENGDTLFFRKLLNFLRERESSSVYIPVRAAHTSALGETVSGKETPTHYIQGASW